MYVIYVLLECSSSNVQHLFSIRSDRVKLECLLIVSFSWMGRGFLIDLVYSSAGLENGFVSCSSPVAYHL
jgi:hypothetical protein